MYDLQLKKDEYAVAHPSFFCLIISRRHLLRPLAA